MLLPKPPSKAQNRAQKLLRYMANVVVNGNPAELGAQVGVEPGKLDPRIPTIEGELLSYQRFLNTPPLPPPGITDE